MNQKPRILLPGLRISVSLRQFPLDHVTAHIKSSGIEIVDGPVSKQGAMGPVESIYVRDPDGNLIEISNYLTVSPDSVLQRI